MNRPATRSPHTPGFLSEVYIGLDFENGDLVKVDDIENLNEQEFINKAQWLNLCSYISRNKSFNAESVFFVENNPFIVFVSATREDQDRLHDIYNRIWCMAGPRFLFISTPVELNVYDLGGKPVREMKELNPLETVKKAAEIASVLNKFRRESVESGEVFGDERFGKIDSRADKALIDDIKSLRKKLFEAGLDGDKLKYAHALIGRSIFIRYLEDRGILTKDYFYEVAGDNSNWKEILEKKSSKTPFHPGMDNLLYLKVLSDMDFTYHLYKKLADDFNGDMFPTDRNEKDAVKAEHLLLLLQFLKGDVQEQENLFFWAYKFDIIPIELISNIYEELYHFEDLENKARGKKGSHGTHYTPASLVEFVLSRVLTAENLRTKPRIIDPACGSGIFLVEAFRRLIRFELHKSKNKNLSFHKLEKILQNQIGGIELNAEAVRIAAFSLYLAFLHYQTPPDILQQIRQGNKLPNLIYTDEKKKGKKYFDILINANAFEIEKAVGDGEVRKKFLSSCADIVVGNPPWGTPQEDKTSERKSLDTVEQWCKDKEKEMPDKELSEAFVWRAIDLLKDSGSAVLLVFSQIFFKNSAPSNRFKRDLLRLIRLQEVVNFVHARDVFFNSAIAPFLSIVFKKEKPVYNSYINYWTARRTKIIDNTKNVVLDKTDFKFFKHFDTTADDIWKIYYFGNHRDYSLISGLRLYPKLKKIEIKDEIKRKPRRQGFTKGEKKAKNVTWLKEYKELPTKAFSHRYGKLDFNRLKDVPGKVEGEGDKENYQGGRILVKGGVTQKIEPKGQLIVRYENETFAFRHSINCIKIKSKKENDYKILIGILWSSLARYYFFMTCSRWGVWHDDVLLDELLELPVKFPEDEEVGNRIVEAVDKLRNCEPGFFNDVYRIEKLERELDEAVFDLYMLTEAECDLIKDRCKYDIGFYYNSSVIPVEIGKRTSGTLQSLPAGRDKQKGLEGYLYVFLKSWNPEVEEGKELNWQIVRHPAIPMIALIFTLQNMGEEKKNNISPGDIPEWGKILAKLEKETQRKYSSRIYIEGILRVVTKNQIIIIKRNEERLWTRSAAYEDVEATLLQAMEKEKQLNA